jgi:hypothetical protein
MPIARLLKKVKAMRTQSPLRLRDAWVIFFFLGLVMLNYPFLHIFNKDVQILGIPLIVCYLLIGWPLSIVVVFLFTLQLDHSAPTDEPEAPAPPKDQA